MSRRSDEIFDEKRGRLHRQTDRMFLVLLVAQWVFAVAVALLTSPYTWTGSSHSLHIHVKAALVLGGLINVLPITLLVTRPGWWGTRQVLAVVQMMWSALLIMVTGGRIETHFHVFGSLAFLALYRDWKLLPTATLVVAIDHLARGLWWPDSVYGIANPEWWRFLEHAGWVVFEDAILIWGCVRGIAEMRTAALHEVELEQVAVTIQRKVENRTRQLQSSMKRYRALVENIEAIPFEYEYSELRRTLFIAPQAARLFGCAEEQLLAIDIFGAVVHDDDRARLLAAIDAWVRGTAPTTSIDYRVVTATERVVHLRALLSPSSGRRISGVLLDVTDQKRLEAENQQVQKLEAVGRLAAGVAHEINTPMQFVGDSVEFIGSAVGDLLEVIAIQQQVVDGVLAGAPSTEVAQRAVVAAGDVDVSYLKDHLPEALARAVDGVERVGSIVRSMKVFSRPDEVAMASIDLNRAIMATLTIARNEYRYVADLETDLGELPPVLCHVGEINQAVLNVVINAAHAIGDVVKATGGRGKLTVTSRADADAVRIAISDTGPGIPAHVAERMFDPFFTTKPVGTGTGQGLAIAHSIVVGKHHGTLTYTTELGVGTTFHITIPAPCSMRVAA